MGARSIGWFVVLVGCSTPSPPPPAPSSKPASSAVVSAPVASATSSAQVEDKPRISAGEAERILFLKRSPKQAASCREEDESEHIRCLIRILYAKDKAARDAALTLYDEAGIVAGVEARHTMDGGWRGDIEIVPEPPLGRHRRHLTWLVTAYRDYAQFFDQLHNEGGAKTSFRFAPIRLRFLRSVGRTTPSAYASGWTVAYNVSGSLHTTANAVRETMFHETFHLNDSAHRQWSRRALSKPFDDVVARCTKGKKVSTPCLRPYAPADTMVRGGTFYAFQPGNGVWEYAAELAVRYYQEHRRLLADKPLAKKAFKCGPEPNPTTWKLLVDEFFGGIDLVPPC